MRQVEKGDDNDEICSEERDSEREDKEGEFVIRERKKRVREK